MSPELQQVVFTIMGALVSVIFWKVSKDLDRLVNGVEQLNTKIAVVIERVDQHESRLNRLETKEI